MTARDAHSQMLRALRTRDYSQSLASALQVLRALREHPDQPGVSVLLASATRTMLVCALELDPSAASLPAQCDRAVEQFRDGSSRVDGMTVIAALGSVLIGESGAGIARGLGGVGWSRAVELVWLR